jgi:hypothetical protein
VDGKLKLRSEDGTKRRCGTGRGRRPERDPRGGGSPWRRGCLAWMLVSQRVCAWEKTLASPMSEILNAKSLESCKLPIFERIWLIRMSFSLGPSESESTLVCRLIWKAVFETQGRFWCVCVFLDRFRGKEGKRTVLPFPSSRENCSSPQPLSDGNCC